MKRSKREQSAATIKKLRAEVEDAMAVIAESEWAAGSMSMGHCPVCGASRYDDGHLVGCRLWAWLERNR